MAIKQSVINTFNRNGIPYGVLLGNPEAEATNRFTGETVKTSALVAHCIDWVYNRGETGVRQGSVTVADFDRVRYFVLAEDNKAYMTCLD